MTQQTEGDPAAPAKRPHEETASAAVGVLQAELGLVASGLDGIDRKASLLPPFLIALGGLLLPAAPWTNVQLAAIVAALVTGFASAFYVRRIVLPTDHNLGPTAAKVADMVNIEPALFRAGVARELATSIKECVALAGRKSAAFRQAANWASAAILFLIAARLAGGIR
jgi:hypothetical protein